MARRPGRLSRSKAQKCGPAALSHGEVVKSTQPQDFSTAKRRSVPGGRSETFARQSAKVCLARAFFPAGFFARYFAAVGPGKKASYKREAAYRKRRKNYVASYLDFGPPRSDLCAAGPENGLGPGRAGKAAAG